LRQPVPLGLPQALGLPEPVRTGLPGQQQPERQQPERRAWAWLRRTADGAQ